MIYKNWLILGFQTGRWRAKLQAYPFTTITGVSLADIQAQIDRSN